MILNCPDNTRQLPLPGDLHPHLIHGSVRPKQHVDRFSRFCTAHRSVALLYNGPLRSPPPKKKIGGSGTNLTHGT